MLSKEIGSKLVYYLFYFCYNNNVNGRGKAKPKRCDSLESVRPNR